MLHSNYNILTLSIEADGKYKIGDVFTIPEEQKKRCAQKFKRFDGLTIEDISYCWGVCLHFNYNDWRGERPSEKDIQNRRKCIVKGEPFK